HEDVGARVQRVDDHLAVDRPRDLHAPVEEVGRERCHRPRALANGRGLGQETGPLSGVEAGLPLAAPGQKLLDASAEAAHQVGHQLQGRSRKHVLVGRGGRRPDLEAAYRAVRRGHSLTLPSPPPPGFRWPDSGGLGGGSAPQLTERARVYLARANAAPTIHPKTKFDEAVSTRCDMRTDSGMYGLGASSITSQTLNAPPTISGSSHDRPR